MNDLDRIHAEERRRSRSEWIRALFRRASEADRKRRARVAKTITILAAWLPHGTCQTAPQNPIIPMPVEELQNLGCGVEFVRTGPNPVVLSMIAHRGEGFDLDVWVFVNESGEVVSDSTCLHPPTWNHEYNKRVISEMTEWSFRPAIRNGVPVGAWFSWGIRMGGQQHAR